MTNDIEVTSLFVNGDLVLRKATEEDVPAFYRHQLDPVANQQAAFTPSFSDSWPDFQAHWERVLNNRDNINYAILLDGVLVGNLVCFPWEGQPNIGYWIDRQYWGRGIATEALRLFLKLTPIRPLYAAAAADNLASIRVLEKGGFTFVDKHRAFSNARNAEIEEVIYYLL